MTFVSRRRKTKCDGRRPSCQHCSSRHIHCAWPEIDISPVPVPQIARSSIAHGESPQTHSSCSPTRPDDELRASAALPPLSSLQRCFDIFFEYHHLEDFCSFLYRPDFEKGYQSSSFLVYSIVSLSSCYLNDDEAKRDFNLSTAKEVHTAFTIRAKDKAREMFDEPTGM